MLRCPICRGRLAEAVCRRCGADLGLAAKAERFAEDRARYAVRALRAGRLDLAALASRQARALHRTPFTIALAEFVAARAGEGGPGRSSLPPPPGAPGRGA